MPDHERLVLPGSLVPDAKAELQRNDLHAQVSRLARDIFRQKSKHSERRDEYGRTLSYGETPSVPVMVDGKELQILLINIFDRSFSQGDDTKYNMGGISIRISKPDSDEFAELGRVIEDGSLGTDRLNHAIVRKVGHAKYKTIDADAEIVEGLLELLQRYGEVIGYDPSKTQRSQQDVA